MLKDKLQPFLDRYNKISELLSDEKITQDIKKLTTLSKEQSDLQKIVDKANEYIQTIEAIEENKELLSDKELGELAKEELKELEPKLPVLEEEIKILLLPTDPNDDKNIYLEIRAGTGGDEASLFVADLFRAYVRYAEGKKWKIEIVSQSESDVGGYKEMILLIKGESVYSRLKYEGGVHRVQRVPSTESQGRVHTSAITVAIMPEVSDTQIEIPADEIKIDVMRSSGAGGQHVNKTESAVRMTHIPTGLQVSMQDERSQQRNKDKALAILKARVFEKYESERLAKIADTRKSQVGSEKWKN